MDDRLDQLERLAKLKDQGVLSEAEFEAQKKQILEGERAADGTGSPRNGRQVATFSRPGG